jgi:hypothetical protein
VADENQAGTALQPNALSPSQASGNSGTVPPVPAVPTEEVPAPLAAGGDYIVPETPVDGFEVINGCADGACGIDGAYCEEGACAPYFAECCPLLYGLGGTILRNVSIYGGAQGFKGPLDQGVNGNFGFHEGFNFGSPLGDPWGIGYQIGFEADHSNFEGSGGTNGPGSNRNQVFLTAGLFHRALCGGIQWGVVFDYLSDDYFDRVEVGQIRTEVSLVRPSFGEFGFWGAFGTNDDNLLVDQTWQGTVQSTDIYALFFRHYYCNGGQGRIWAGATGEGEGILGADFGVPVTDSWVLETNFTYLIPSSSNDATGREEEAWGMALQLVWYPGRRACGLHTSQFEPILPVASNSWFLTHVERAGNGQ